MLPYSGLPAANLASGGAAAHCVAWDGVAGQPAAYDPATSRYGAPVAHLALEGEAMVATKQGMLPCRPVFAHYAELCAHYTPERVADICWMFALVWLTAATSESALPPTCWTPAGISSRMRR